MEQAKQDGEGIDHFAATTWRNRDVAVTTGRPHGRAGDVESARHATHRLTGGDGTCDRRSDRRSGRRSGRRRPSLDALGGTAGVRQASVINRAEADPETPRDAGPALAIHYPLGYPPPPDKSFVVRHDGLLAVQTRSRATGSRHEVTPWKGSCLTARRLNPCFGNLDMHHLRGVGVAYVQSVHHDVRHVNHNFPFAHKRMRHIALRGSLLRMWA